VQNRLPKTPSWSQYAHGRGLEFPGNLADAKPRRLKSVILRISEVSDLGGVPEEKMAEKRNPLGTGIPCIIDT
jgi:hypothetical protein